MTDIFDKLDKSLEENKSKIKKKQELWSKVVNEQNKILDDFFKKNILKDFEKLVKIYKKHIGVADNKLINYNKGSKLIKIRSESRWHDWTTELKIEVDKKTPPLPTDTESIKDLEKYKPAVENIYFEVSRLDENGKGDILEFKYSEKEKAYDYLNKNFKKYILHILSDD